MDLKTLKSVLEIGETIAVEFKRCGNGIESDTYESVCSFLNRFGGDIFLGVLDDQRFQSTPSSRRVTYSTDNRRHNRFYFNPRPPHGG